MMMNIWLVFLHCAVGTVWFLCAADGSSYQQCNKEALVACVDQVNEFVTNFTSEDDMHLTDEYFDRKCSLLQEASVCARAILKHCTVLEEAFAEGQLTAAQYRCDKRQVVLDNQVCLADKDLYQQVRQCTYTEFHYQAAENAQHLCSNFQHDLDCVHSHVLRVCGNSEVAQFQYNYYFILLRQIFRMLRCDINIKEVEDISKRYPMGNRTLGHMEVDSISNAQARGSLYIVHGGSHGHFGRTALVAVVIAGVVLIALMGVVCMCACKKGKPKDEDEERSGGNGAPTITTTALDGTTALENPMYSVGKGLGATVVNLEVPGCSPIYDTIDDSKLAKESNTDDQNNQNNLNSQTAANHYQGLNVYTNHPRA